MRCVHLPFPVAGHVFSFFVYHSGTLKRTGGKIVSTINISTVIQIVQLSFSSNDLFDDPMIRTQCCDLDGTE